MITVSADGDESLANGSLRCPVCQGALRPWGFARRRPIRTGGAAMWVRPRRARCGACGRTQVLLPQQLLSRRRDAAVDVGVVLEAYAHRAGYRRAARDLGIPVPTARNWVRQLRGRWWRILAHFDPEPEPADAVPDDPLAAVTGVHRVAEAEGWTSDPWELASLQSNGRLFTGNTS
jgi:hypothetical protein